MNRMFLLLVAAGAVALGTLSFASDAAARCRLGANQLSGRSNAMRMSPEPSDQPCRSAVKKAKPARPSSR